MAIWKEVGKRVSAVSQVLRAERELKGLMVKKYMNVFDRFTGSQGSQAGSQGSQRHVVDLGDLTVTKLHQLHHAGIFKFKFGTQKVQKIRERH